VCVPTYNYARFLPDCIASVQQQTLPDWELVICDDQSTDATESIIASYAVGDSRIRYIRHAKRLGMNPNLKFAADQGRGKYLKILCADDWLAPRCLEVMIRLMEQHPGVALGTCAEIHTDAAGNPQFVQFLFGKPVSILSGEKMLDRMAAGSRFGGNSSFMIRADAYREVGGYCASMRYCGDFELAARLCRVGDYLHTDEPLFYGRDHESSSSSNDPDKLLDAMDFLELPGKLCVPRPFMSREWFRYERFSGHIAARYFTLAIVEWLRGRRGYGRRLLSLLRQQGNFAAGLVCLPFHLIYRLYAWTVGRNVTSRQPVQSGVTNAAYLKNEPAMWRPL
jgi:glycosyltransferase involved in cell wall biosynthesis